MTAPHDSQLDLLVEQFGHRVRFFANRIQMRFGLDPQWRDDLISSGYMGLLKALQNRRADAHEHELSAYVSKRVEGAVIDEARRVLTRMSTQAGCDPTDFEAGLGHGDTHLDWNLGEADPDPEDLADRQGRWRTIEACTKHLERSHQELLWAYAEGRSISEIARSGGQSATRIQSQMARITREIRARSPELRRVLRYEI